MKFPVDVEGLFFSCGWLGSIRHNEASTGRLKMTMTKKLIGISPAGVEWVCYPRNPFNRKNPESDESFLQRVEAMTERLEALKARHAIKEDHMVFLSHLDVSVIHVGGFTPTQVGWINETLELSNQRVEVGRSWIEATNIQLRRIQDDVHDLIENDDHEMIVAGNSNKDLTEAQVAFGALSRVKSLKATAKKLNLAINMGRS